MERRNEGQVLEYRNEEFHRKLFGHSFGQKRQQNLTKKAACVVAGGSTFNLTFEFVDNFFYYRAVLNVGGCRSKAKRRVDNAPPVVALARAEFHD